MRVELLTSDHNHVAWVALPPFVSPRAPDVVVWGTRCFTREPRPAGRDEGDSIFWWVEAFMVVSLTPSPGLPRGSPPPAARVAVDGACRWCGNTAKNLGLLTGGSSTDTDEEVADLEALAKTDLLSHEAKCPRNAASPARAARVLTTGEPVPDDQSHTALRPNGQQAEYVILSDEERAKGFVRPVRRSYVHERCGATTTMGLKLAETYARDPGFYSGTFCATCRAHFPVGEAGEFVWEGTHEKVGS